MYMTGGSVVLYLIKIFLTKNNGEKLVIPEKTTLIIANIPGPYRVKSLHFIQTYYNGSLRKKKKKKNSITFMVLMLKIYKYMEQ